MKLKRNALNRGTAVYLGGSRVRFIWACGCKRVETVKCGRGSSATPMSADALMKLVLYWRRIGVTLRQCKRHPDYYSRASRLDDLNAENPNDREEIKP